MSPPAMRIVLSLLGKAVVCFQPSHEEWPLVGPKPLAAGEPQDALFRPEPVWGVAPTPKTPPWALAEN